MNNKNLHRKLNKSLRTLEEMGYFTAKNFWCCNTCGWGAIEEDKRIKAVFYNAQDAEYLREKGRLHLAWSGSGKEIVDVLKSNKLFVDWDGEEDKRIFIADSEYNPKEEFLKSEMDRYNRYNKESLDSNTIEVLSNLHKEALLEASILNIDDWQKIDEFKKAKIDEYEIKLKELKIENLELALLQFDLAISAGINFHFESLLKQKKRDIAEQKCSKIK